jgi:hypothetical protein
MRLAAIMLLFKEQAFVEASVRAVYPVVDSVCCASRHDRNFAGDPLAPDRSLDALLAVPDPENKIRVVIQRDLKGMPGENSEARLRNAAMALDAQADYYLIVDSDEIWPREVLQACWNEVQRTQWAAYRVSSYAYFRQWNYRIVEPGDGYRPLVFIRRGFPFKADRQIEWHAPARWKEYLRKGRKPKTVFFSPELRMHHGSCVGDDTRMLNKLPNYGHADGVDPGWFERVWKNFHPGIRNFHYFGDRPHLYESLVTIPTKDLPPEIREASWPGGWIEPVR